MQLMKGTTMKSFLAILSISIILFGCEKELVIDTTPPPPPQGIQTISLDNAVELQWMASQAEDVQGYHVWVSDSYNGRYASIAAVSGTSFIDGGALNGVTYYYAVSAYDFDDNESELSKDVVYDTPRPEGYGVVLSNDQISPNYAGYDFSQYDILRYDNVNADFFFENLSGRSSLYVWDDSDIQDMGYSNSLDEISSSPTQGWAPSKSAEAIVGHTYIIWTWDDHYAKVRVKEVNANQTVFDWAYQTAKGNPELRIAGGSLTGRKPLKRVHVPV
jgi:hypothetical protein